MADFNVRLRLRRIKVYKSQVVGPRGLVTSAAERAGEKLVEYAREELTKDGKGYRTGNLYNSINYRVSSDGMKTYTDVGSFNYPVPYAMYVHDGTPKNAPGRGRIYPTRAKKLRFKGWDGLTYYKTSVAGQKANPYLRNAIARLRAEDLT